MTDTTESRPSVLKNAIFILLAYGAVMSAVAGYLGYKTYAIDHEISPALVSAAL